MSQRKLVELSKEEMMIANTGLGVLIQMMENNDPTFKHYMFDHPFQNLITHENIMKLSKKFRLDEK